MPHPLLRRNRNRQINTSIRRQARRDARHRGSIAVTEAANLLVHGILDATEEQYDAVMDVHLDDTNLDLDNNFQNRDRDPDRVIKALVRHAKKKLKDLIQRKVQQVDFRVHVLLYHRKNSGMYWRYRMMSSGQMSTIYQMMYQGTRALCITLCEFTYYPGINKAFEEMTNALVGTWWNWM